MVLYIDARDAIALTFIAIVLLCITLGWVRDRIRNRFK